MRLGAGGRLVIRPSGTEPVIRVMAEGDDRDLVRARGGRRGRGAQGRRSVEPPSSVRSALGLSGDPCLQPSSLHRSRVFDRSHGYPALHRATVIAAALPVLAYGMWPVSFSRALCDRHRQPASPAAGPARPCRCHRATVPAFGGWYLRGDVGVASARSGSFREAGFEAQPQGFVDTRGSRQVCHGRFRRRLPFRRLVTRRRHQRVSLRRSARIKATPTARPG